MLDLLFYDEKFVEIYKKFFFPYWDDIDASCKGDYIFVSGQWSEVRNFRDLYYLFDANGIYISVDVDANEEWFWKCEDQRVGSFKTRPIAEKDAFLKLSCKHFFVDLNKVSCIS